MSEERQKTMAELREVAAKYFAAHPEYKSMMLGVSQYWADEADDAVHYDIVVSAREQPLWPHRCSDTNWSDDGEYENVPGEGCWNCVQGIEYMNSWDDNGDSIAAFEAYCHEQGSQEEQLSHNILPYAVARKVGDAVEVEVVGRLQRPENIETEEGPSDFTWNDPRAKELLDLVAAAPHDDAPRRVLADFLMEKETPRGEYIALALDGKHPSGPERQWMSPLGKVMPAWKFERGFLVAGEVFASEGDLDIVRGAPAWSTVERLYVHRNSDVVLDPAMRALRELGPIDSAWMEALVETPQPWAIEKLEIELGDASDVKRLAATTKLPKLRHLTLRVDTPDHVARLQHAVWWPQLERLTVTGYLADWVKRRKEVTVPWLGVVSLYVEPSEALGWEVALGPNGACEATLRGITPHGSLEALAELLPQVQAAQIKLVRSPYYVPSEVDIERLAAATSVPIVI